MMRYVSGHLACAMLVSACGFTPSTATDDAALIDGAGSGSSTRAWLEPWAHRKAVTLHAARIEVPANDTALTNFPVMISLDDPDLTAGLLQDASDLAVTGADATTVLDREVESYAAGSLVAWVRVPSLSATVDTTLYLYYGNASPPVPVPGATWDASFLAVYHLQQDPGPGGTGDIRDATANHHDGTAGQAMASNQSVEGQIGRAIHLAGTSDYIGVPVLDLGNAFTISMWIDMDGDSGIHSLLSNSSDGSNTDGFRFFVNSNGSTDHTVHVETGDGGTSNSVITPANAIAVGTWTHVAAIVDRTGGRAEILVNGQPAATSDTSILTTFKTSNDLELGRMKTNNPFPGTLDEIELASIDRSDEWIRTAYHDQGDPSTFYTVGTEEDR